MQFRRSTVAIALCVMWISLVSRPANADLVLVLSPSSGTVEVGQTLDVEILLLDTTGDYLNAAQAGSGGGLTRFGFRGNFDPVVFDPIGYDLPAAFPFPESQITPGVGSFTVSGEKPLNGVVFGSPSGGSSYSISLGTVHLLAVTPSTGSQLTLTDPNPSADNFFMAGTVGVDSDVFATGSPTVATYVVTAPISAVPEPGSMSLVALASGGLWLVQRRRRRRAQ